MQKYKSQSNAIPLPVDEASSPTTTYVNENVEEKTRTNEDGVTETYYVYDVTKFSKDEYAMWLVDKELSQEQLTQKSDELQAYLDDTDWYAARLAETGVKIPKDVLKTRSDARLEISLLRDLENIEKE